MTKLTFFWCLLFACTGQQVNLESVPISEDMLRLLKNSTAYRRFATPTQDLARPTNVSLSMYIEGLSSFSPRTMDFQMDVYFQQQWQDTRLKHSSNRRMLLRDREVFNMMWAPDLYFANAKTSKFQEVTKENFLVWIYDNGTVFYDASKSNNKFRISLTVICMMDLSKYPMDSQVCELKIMSYAYDDTQLRINWKDVDAVSWNSLIKMPDMDLTNITTVYCEGLYATGNWSCVQILLYVKRELMHHVMQTYLPSALIVVISWFSFWLDVDAAPARVSLSITTLLTVSTQANTVKMSLPEVSYMKAIDVWMGVCMTFVFGVMIEFTVCHYARNRREKEPDKSALGAGGLAAAVGFASGSAMLARRTSDPNTNSTAATPYLAHRALEELEETETMLASPTNSPHVLLNRFSNNNRQYAPNSGTPTTARLMNHIHENNDIEPPPPHQRHLLRKESALNMHRTLLRQATQGTAKWMNTLKSLQGRRAAQQIDERCRWLFPLSFFLFNLVYWVYYLFLAPNKEI